MAMSCEVDYIQSLRVITTNAIVIKIAPYSESTLLTTLLTPEFGVIRGIAKGARRPRRQQSAYEPFTLVEMSLQMKPSNPEELATIYESITCEDWSYLRANLDRLAYAGVGIEVLTTVASRSLSDRYFFDEAKTFLTVLAHVNAPGSLLVSLLIRLLHHTGFPPQLSASCHGASGRLPEELTYHFDDNCFCLPSPNDSSNSLKIRAEMLEPLLNALATPPLLDGSLVLNARAGQAALAWLIRVWGALLGSPLKASEFLRSILQPRTIRS